jgi:hypothetical protein
VAMCRFKVSAGLWICISQLGAYYLRLPSARVKHGVRRRRYARCLRT